MAKLYNTLYWPWLSSYTQQHQQQLATDCDCTGGSHGWSGRQALCLSSPPDVLLVGVKVNHDIRKWSQLSDVLVQGVSCD